jgi:hypothetical protein
MSNLQPSTSTNPTNPSIMRPAAPVTGRLNSKGQAKPAKQGPVPAVQAQAKQGPAPQAGSATAQPHAQSQK